MPTISDVRHPMLVYDPIQMALVLWDGSLSVGSVTIGAVTQAGSWTVAVSQTVLTPSAPAAATVGVASAQAVASNANRKGLILINTHATQRISLAFGATAVLDAGVTLYANGGSYAMGTFDVTTAAVNAIASGASTNLAIQEYT